MVIKQLFGKNLHEYRKIKKMSQEQLAEKLGISVKHLSTLETGKCFVSAELLEKIVAVLNISPAALFYSDTDSSIDNSELSLVDNIIEEEIEKFRIATKQRIHRLKTEK